MHVDGTDGFPFLLPFWTIECKKKVGSQVEGGGWFGLFPVLLAWFSVVCCLLFIVIVILFIMK